MSFEPLNYTNINTTSQQVDAGVKAISSSMSSTTGLVTSASSMLGSVGDIASKAFSAGQSMLNSGFSALSQLGSFTTVSKFTDNLKMPDAIIQDKPELYRGKTESPAGSLKYPKDESPYSISFMFQRYVKPSPVVPKTQVPSVTITLPMPSDLVDKFNAQYSNRDLNLITKALQEAGVFEKAASGEFKGIGEQAGRGLSKLMTGTNAYAAGRSAIGDSSIGAAADRATGTTINPYTALQFNGVGLRKHNFRFKLSPNSRDEALEIQKIIRAFKERMLPEKNGLLFVFPDTCIIKFNTPNMPYSFKTCFLESLSVNYAPSGTPSFFKGGEFTTEVEISLEFGETEPVTRDDVIKGGGDITGSGNPYDSSNQGTGLTLGQASSKAAKDVVVPIARTTNDQGVAGVQTDSGESFGVGGLTG